MPIPYSAHHSVSWVQIPPQSPSIPGRIKPLASVTRGVVFFRRYIVARPAEKRDESNVPFYGARVAAKDGERLGGLRYLHFFLSFAFAVQ